jgi:hypothetical protein
MRVTKWDRIYLFMFAATALAVVGFIVLLVAPTLEVINLETGEISHRTRLSNGQSGLLLLYLLPIFLAGSALLASPRRNQPDKASKINIWLSLAALYLFIGLQIQYAGIVYVPAVIMMTAAAVGSMVSRKGRQGFASSETGSKSGRGGGKRRRNKG